VLLGGVGPTAGTRGRAGHDKGRRGQAERITAEAGGADGRCVLRGRAGQPARGQGKVGLAQGRARRGRPGAVGAEPRCSARGERGAGVASAWLLGSGAQKSGESREEQKNGQGQAEEHKDPPYVPQLSDLAEGHKSLCSSGI
jgi:hypothetical protein